jgi:hypothetical protein
MLQKITRLKLNVGVAVCFLIGFVGTAMAATVAVPDPDGNLLDFAAPILDAIKNGNGWIAAALTLIVASAAARRYLAPKLPFLKTAFGAVVLVFTASYGAAVLTGLAAAGTSTLNASLAYAAFKVALAAAGGFSVLRPLLVDLVEPFVVGKLPWLKPVFDLLTWAFDKPDAIADATKAGDDAVKQKPSGGAAGVVGTSTEIE